MLWIERDELSAAKPLVTLSVSPLMPGFASAQAILGALKSREPSMKSVGIFLLFLPAAVLAAGLFGIIHDQISYTVSNEYFTKFKFIQFRLLDSGMPDRFRAGEVGFLASWWMGIPLGILCGLAGFVQRSPSLMRDALIWSLPVITMFTLTVALTGLAYGWYQTATIDTAAYRGWFIPHDVTELRRFLCAGYMHNSAYIGGGLSIPVAWLFHLIFRARTLKPIEVRRSPQAGNVTSASL